MGHEKNFERNRKGHSKLFHKFTKNQQKAKVIFSSVLITDGSKLTETLKKLTYSVTILIGVPGGGGGGVPQTFGKVMNLVKESQKFG